MSHLFIERPIFAWVISIVILLLGCVAVISLSVAQYPNITPPSVQVTASYPAPAPVVADSVAAPIEQQVNGVEKSLYMSSQCTNDGSYTLTVTFELGTDLNIAQVLVQNRVALAMSQLPEQVQMQGVNTNKQSPAILLAVNLISPDGQYDNLYLSNYATLYIKDPLARLDGVGNINYLGERDYSMRAWLDPDKMAAPQHRHGRCHRRGEKSKCASRRRHYRARPGSQRPAVSIDHEHAGPAHGCRPVQKNHHQNQRRRPGARPRCRRVSSWWPRFSTSQLQLDQKPSVALALSTARLQRH